MPSYTFFCNNCNTKYEIVCSIKNYHDKLPCDLCHGSDVIRMYTEDVLTQSSSVKKSDSELKTIGDLAKRNSDRMSEDQKHALYMKHNSYKDQQDLKPLPTGMSRVKKAPKIKWPGTSGIKQKRKPKNG
jgi:hypothetical protein